MLEFLTHPRLITKVILLGAGSVLITAVALVLLSAWQSEHYQSLAQKEVDGLIEADLDHITQGVYSLVQTEGDAVQQQVNYNLNVAEHVLASAGAVTLARTMQTWTAVNQFTQERTEIQLPEMLVGATRLGQNTDPATKTPVVDEVTRMVGETATIFQRMNERGDMLRVATTVTNNEGQRAIGTYIPAINPDGQRNPVIAAILQGKTYHGRAFVVNAWYLTAYEPIHDAAGNLVGMLYGGVQQKHVEARVRPAILRTRVGRTGYVYVLGGSGNDRGRYIISQHGERDGESIWESQDGDGQLVIQRIIAKAVALRPDEIATERYRWQNPGEAVPRWKVARLMYYAPWDWVIGISAYEDELQHYQTVLNAGRVKVTGFMSAAGLLIALLVGLAGVFLAWTITRPIRQITHAADTITRGDLSQMVEVRSRDEIGVLANSFNFMTTQLRHTLAGLRQENLDREKAELALRAKTEELDRFFSLVPDLLCILDATGCFKRLNPEWETTFGCSIRDFEGRSLLEWVHPEEVEATRNVLARLAAGQEAANFSNRCRCKLGAYRWIEWRASPYQGQLIYVAGRDSTERRVAEERIREQAALLQASHDAILVWHMQQGIQFMNLAAEQLTGVGVEQAQAKDLSSVLRLRSDLDLRGAIQEVATHGKWAGELTVVTGDDSVRDVASRWTALSDAGGKPASVLITCNDITEKKQLERQYLRAQRLESVGTLASGVAHDLNNILSPIVMGVDLLNLTASDAETRDTLRMMRECARRGVDTVKQLLTFARGADSQKGPVQPQLLLKEVVRLVQQTFPKNIQVYTDAEQHLATVMADPSQLHQVLMNLCVNARDAMPDGGVLSLTLESESLDEAGATIHPKARPVTYVVFRVTDSGAGIHPEVLERIFDPFYTTKPQGKGTGLGLATVMGIVENHGGFVVVDSKPGEGATFQVFLPVSAPASEMSREPEARVAPSGHGQLVLVVDDEPAILQLAAQILRRAGYRVLTTSNASEALHTFEKQHADIRAVLTDIMMPFGDGRRLISALHEQSPRLPIIAMSGLATAELEQEALQRGVRAFIRKPFAAEDLIRRVADALDQKLN